VLEYLDFETRKAMLETIYSSYISEKYANVAYGKPDPAIIAEWENYRYYWLHKNIIAPLEQMKASN
jgi:hypothetical protein